MRDREREREGLEHITHADGAAGWAGPLSDTLDGYPVHVLYIGRGVGSNTVRLIESEDAWTACIASFIMAAKVMAVRVKYVTLLA